MNARFPREKSWPWISIVTLSLVYLWAGIQSVSDVAAVQNAVQRDWEITFGPPSAGAPPGMPSFVDSAAVVCIRRTIDEIGRDAVWKIRIVPRPQDGSKWDKYQTEYYAKSPR